MSGALINPIPVVLPGETAQVSVDLIAPARGGQRTGNWEFQNSNGERFGVGAGGNDYIWVQIQVEWSSAGGSQPSDPEPSAPSDCQEQFNPGYVDQLFALINTARTEQGLNTLTLNSQLSSAALDHSQDMACHNYVDHTGSDGSTWYDRVAAHGYANYNSARENIYVGDPAYGGTPDGAFEWWMNSQVHRDNILFASISEIGIGYVYNPSSDYGGYYTIVFARP
jgi:uncharacterized protein YkwD